MPFAGRRPETDVSAGGWIARAVPPDARRTVAGLVPPVFDAYARVLHPAVRYPDDDTLPDVDVRWADVAAANGRVAHPAMGWASITGSWDYVAEDDQPGLWNQAPAEGHLPVTTATRLAAVLARQTADPADCWFGVWAGWGFVTADAPALELSWGGCWLLRGPVGSAAANLADEPHEQSASLWWPADRAWFVATHPDGMSTYVGGSAACVAAVLADPGLEALPVVPGQPVTPDADTVNPPPDALPA